MTASNQKNGSTGNLAGSQPDTAGSIAHRFDRREQKFVILKDAASRILPEVRARLLPDPHGDDDASYRVATLYMDSPDKDVYWERARGITPRHKLRLRRYGAPGPSIKDSVTFLEVKTRLRRRVVKRRMHTSVEEALRLYEGGVPDRHLSPGESLLLDDIHHMVRARDLEPAVMIVYRRQAWIGPDDLRVTFDSNLSWRTTNLEDFADPAVDGPLLPDDKLVLELKYPDAIPYWLAQHLARHGGVMRRFSKYCQAVELAGLIQLPDPEHAESASYFSPTISDAWNPSAAS